MEKRNQMPWFLDPKTHRFKLIVSLPYGLFAAVLMVLAFGVSLLTVSAAVATVVTCVGQLYLAEYVAGKMP